MKNVVVIVLYFCIYTSIGYTQNGHGKTTHEMHVDADDEYTKVDKELNEVYAQIIDRYKSDSVFIQKLKLAQRQWIASRDADMLMLFPYKENDAQRNYGSIFPVCYSLNVTSLTKERIKFLRRWIETIDDGVSPIEVCNGSIIPVRK
ncbi:DUF1311 domain-containing protein [bacterium]|nr:DUF1311 domain-containing protein [bacterium]